MDRAGRWGTFRTNDERNRFVDDERDTAKETSGCQTKFR